MMDKLLPDAAINGVSLQETVQKMIEPSKTLKLRIYEKRMHGVIVDEREALQQMIYKYVNTEKGNHIIYSNFGLKKKDVFFQPKAYAYHVLCARIKEDLEWDDRIDRVDGFYMDEKRSTRRDLAMGFVVHSIFGNLAYEGVVKLG